MGFQISHLPPIPSCQLTDLIPEVQPAIGGTTYKATLQQVLNLIQKSNSIPYTDVTTSSLLMEQNNGYVSNNSGLVTLTLPTIAEFGSRLEIIGLGSGGWSISQNTGQSIQIGNFTSTIGISGSISSSIFTDSVSLVCIIANTKWATLGGPESSGLTIL